MRNYHALAMHSLRVQDWLQVSKGVLMSFLDSWAYFFVVAGWDEGHKHHIFSNISLDQEPRKQGCKGGSSTPWYFYGVERGGGVADFPCSSPRAVWLVSCPLLPLHLKEYPHFTIWCSFHLSDNCFCLRLQRRCRLVNFIIMKTQGTGKETTCVCVCVCCTIFRLLSGFQNGALTFCFS